MGTPNFMNLNASKHFIIEEGENEFEFDFKKDEIQMYLTENGYDLENGHPSNDNRSFPSVLLASKTKEKEISENPINITIYVVVRAGYYAHANLDWNIEIQTATHNFEDEIPDKDFIADEFEDLGFSRGFGVIQSKNVLNYINNTIDELIKETENHFAKVTQTYKRIAVASNGEAFYEKV